MEQDDLLTPSYGAPGQPVGVHTLRIVQFTQTTIYIFIHTKCVIFVIGNYALMFTWDTSWNRRHDIISVIFPFLIFTTGVGYWETLH